MEKKWNLPELIELLERLIILSRGREVIRPPNVWLVSENRPNVVRRGNTMKTTRMVFSIYNQMGRLKLEIKISVRTYTTTFMYTACD